MSGHLPHISGLGWIHLAAMCRSGVETRAVCDDDSSHIDEKCAPGIG
jgi:hypothetical protein